MPRIVDIDLSKLEPLTAKPHSPDNIGTSQKMKEIAVDQVCLGSCTNSSYKDLVTVAKILKGKVVHPDVSFILAPGSRQVLENLAAEGYLMDLISAGARLMENACGFLHWQRSKPEVRRRISAHIEPEFLRTIRNHGCRCLSGQPGNRRGSDNYRPVHRSAQFKNRLSPGGNT